jgi:hypothetical protein
MNNKPKLKLPFVLLTLLLNSNLILSQIEYPLKIDFIIVGTPDCYNNSDLNPDRMTKQYKNVFGVLKLENKSDSVYSFWIMNCSWTDLIKVEPESILLFVKKCDKNYPKKISLESHQSILFNSIIEIPSEYYDKSFILQSDGKYNTFKIGFIVITDEEGSYYWKYRDKKRKENDYVWTPPINIAYRNYRWEILN